MISVGNLERNDVNFSWLIKLRWSSIVGQLATILAVRFVVGINLPLGALGVVVALEVLSNLACELWYRRGPKIGEWHLASVMGLDIGFLTALLYFTGGPSNPFSFLYLVNIALAAVIIHALWTWMLVAISLLCFGLLPALDYWPLRLDALSEEARQSVDRFGMWVAFAVAAGFIVHFLWRITGSLAQREKELGEVREAATRQRQMASLATIAAGAAHELATPLGTISLIAKELERGAASSDAGTMEDIQLIRHQVGRCRAILDQMAGGTGKSGEDAVESVAVSQLLDEAMVEARARPPIELKLSAAAAKAMIDIPPAALAQAIRNLVTNAQDASPKKSVTLAADVEDSTLTVEIRDRGAGMPTEILERCGEPFFTTKAPGAGMGLGLFLSRAVVEGLGGDISIESVASEGTRVRVSIPMKRTDAGEHPIGTSHAEPPIHTDR